ncbi:MAG: VacJ family lipoprotein [Rhodobacteraceae bacterium]|nr:VacJ family lipoprotein [Paracoccaceae bacterium]
MVKRSNQSPALHLAMLVLLAVAACSPAPQATGISDPNEAANRRMHAFNLRLDQALFSAASDEDETKSPSLLLTRVTDFASNTALPSLIVNDLLQGNIEDAAHNSVRLLFNTTIGLAGLFDPATGVGLEQRSTDFGETLHVWGVAEGDYVVLPFYGPSTQRDAVGIAVDFFTNPLSYTLPNPESYLPAVAKVVAPLGGRVAYASTVNDILYGSEDGYLTARLFYLDNRRYNLSGGESSDELYDIYEEAYD